MWDKKKHFFLNILFFVFVLLIQLIKFIMLLGKLTYVKFFVEEPKLWSWSDYFVKESYM